MQVELKKIKNVPFDGRFFLVFVIVCLLGTACDTAFQPKQENDQYHFSIFGMLDASVDTQWVRIMPVREEFLLEPGKPIDATVTLEHMETGNSVVMNDSLFQYAYDVYAWNYWTTMDLLPEHTYRLTVRRSDGKTSYAEVTLPADFPTPMIRMGTEFGEPNVLWIDRSIEKLSDIQTVYHGRVSINGDIQVRAIPHLQDTLQSSSDYITAYLYPQDDGPTLEGLIIFKRIVVIAAGGPDTHNFSAYDDKTLALTEGISNIENGVGYLAGIISKAIPYRSCFEENGFTLRPCPIDTDPW